MHVTLLVPSLVSWDPILEAAQSFVLEIGMQNYPQWILL